MRIIHVQAPHAHQGRIIHRFVRNDSMCHTPQYDMEDLYNFLFRIKIFCDDEDSSWVSGNIFLRPISIGGNMLYA